MTFPHFARVIVLENNTVTHLNLMQRQWNITKVNDTVWVDLNTHTINDTCNTAMKCVVDELY